MNENRFKQEILSKSSPSQACRTLKLILIFCLFSTLSRAALSEQHDKYRVLMLTQTVGYRHDSIPSAIAMMHRGSISQDWELTIAEDLDDYIREDVLHSFDVVAFILTLGDIFTETHKKAFRSYMDSGGGMLGVHSSSDTNKGWPWFVEQVGVTLSDHPPVQTAQIITQDRSHATTYFMSEKWELQDEYYNFGQVFDHSQHKMILSVNENTCQGGSVGDPHAVSWTRVHPKGLGRIWCTALGHVGKLYSENDRSAQWFQKHVLTAVEWVAQGTRSARRMKQGISRLQEEESDPDESYEPDFE